jgi:hypothetical protein
MKKTCSLLFSIVLFCSLFAFNQERENPVIEVQIGPPLGRLTEAVGWAFDKENKQWKSGKNKIPSFWAGYKYEQLGEENFDFMETRKVTFDNKEFYILIMQYTTGHFKYESIQKGWYTIKEYNYWVFTPGDWARLRYLKDRRDNFVVMLEVDDGYDMGAVDLVKIRNKLKLDEVEKRLARGDEFNVYVYPMEDKQLIQFSLRVSTSPKYRWKTPEDKRYYEIPESAYFQLFNIEKIPYGTPIGEEIIAANRVKLIGKTIRFGYNWYKKQDIAKIIDYFLDGEQQVITVQSLNGKKTQEFKIDDLNDIEIVKEY